MILLGSANREKQSILSWVVDEVRIYTCTPQDLNLKTEIYEGQTSHRENAVKKASEWSKLARGLAIASDGGILIPFLGSSWNSVNTDRFAGLEATNLEKTRRLLELMGALIGNQRQVRWIECLALAENGKLLGDWTAEGRDGVLVDVPEEWNPSRGLWVDALWYFPDLDKMHTNLSTSDRKRINDPWEIIKPKVQWYLSQEYLITTEEKPVGH